MAKKVGVGDGCTMTSLNTSYDPSLRAGQFATSDKVDTVSKDGSGHRQPAISEQIFCLDVKRVFSIFGYMWTELLYFDLDSFCSCLSDNLSDVFCGFLLCTNLTRAPRIGQLQGEIIPTSFYHQGRVIDCR